MTITRSRHCFTVGEYQEMIERNILTEQDDVELIRGEIVEQMTIGKRHAATVKRLNLFFTLLAQGHYVVSVQDPIGLEDSVPEPDIALLTYRDDLYESQIPTPSDVLLLIEVADSSLEYDKTEKLSVYAEAGIREYWIANLNNDCVEVYRDPQPNGTYAEVRVLKSGETLSIVRLSGVAVAVDDIFKVRGDR